MITRDGVDWLTADEIAQQLGADITQPMLWAWKRRGLIRGTIITGVAHYRHDDVQDAERSTRVQPAGRPRRGT